MAQAVTAQGAVVSNGTVMLGVNSTGDLNYDCAGAGDTGCPAPSLTGATAVGVRYVPFNSDATAPGCLCEGWGAADAGSGLTGNADQDTGVVNVTVNSFTADGSTATSNTTISDATKPGFQLGVVQKYQPSSFSPNMYEDIVTITNTGTNAVTDLRYNRNMDWDAEPTAFKEWVTIQNPGNSSHLLFDSDDGFAAPDPLSALTYLDSESVCGTGYTGPCTFNDLGTGGTYPTVTTPDDHGAQFRFGFGALAVGQSKSFRIYYGATANEANAQSALTAGGAEVYSLGETNCPVASPDGGNATDCASEAPFSGVTLGTPVTYIFGFVTSTADVSIHKAAAPNPVVVGHNLTYTLQVHNNGPDPAAGVTATDPLPSGTTLVSAHSTAGTCSGTTTVTCHIGTVASGANVTVTIVVRPNHTGTLHNTATVSSPSFDTALGNNTASTTTTVISAAVAPRIALSGVPSGCFARTARIHVRITDTAKMKSVTVRLDGRKIKSTKSKRFTVVLSASSLRVGRHTLIVSAVNTAGKRSTRRAHFRRCAPPHPVFTG